MGYFDCSEKSEHLFSQNQDLDKCIQHDVLKSNWSENILATFCVKCYD